MPQAPQNTVLTGPLFSLGKLAATSGAAQACLDQNIDLTALITRHATGDFGDLCESDRALNIESLSGENPGRLMSVYKLPTLTLWIITEWDRSVTTTLLPEEY